MSSVGRVATVVAVALVLALGAGVVWLAMGTRQALQAEQTRRNQDAAALLAERISQAGAAAGGAEATALLTAAFARSDAVRVLFRPVDDRPAIDYRHPGTPTRAPGWFVALLPVAGAPGWASIRAGDHELATLQLVGRSAAAQDLLWDLCGQALACWLALAAAAIAAAWAATTAWRRALTPVQAQAQALEQGRLIEIDEPAEVDLQRLVRSLNRAVQRLRGLFAAQARQVALLQRQAQLDAVTSLPMRRSFVGLLQQRLAGQGGPGVALLLLQVPRLETLNERLGHEATDHLLCAIADLLLTYVDRVAGAFAGRLNGSDFALCLPVSGLAGETAESLRTALLAAPALRASGIMVLIAGVDGLRETTAGAALAAADAALARAQAEDRVAVDAQGELVAAPAGARAWREQISAALAEGRTQLGEYPVVDRDGALIHLECPLRVQLSADGPFEVARRWLALARRSRLLPQVDLAAIDLALRASSVDGLARAVHVSLASLAAPEFIAEVGRRLAASPKAALKLALECVQGGGTADAGLLADAAAAWRLWGVRVGVEHAGGSPQQLPGLQNAGIDYVKVDARNLRGVAADAALRGYAQSLVVLIHGLGLAALAEGVDDAQDLAALWDLGFDGATGPVLAGSPAA